LNHWLGKGVAATTFDLLVVSSCRLGKGEAGLGKGDVD
jgi:hypothetical protein